MAEPTERAENGGISFLRAGRAGGARPLVLLHGIGSNALSFAPLMARLAGRRELLAWDAPGYGASVPLADEWPATTVYAHALAAMLDRLGHKKIDLLGHSLGALIAGRFAALYPDRVDKLVLASPALGYKTQPGEPLAPGAAARIDAMMNEGVGRFAAARGPRLVFRKDMTDVVASVVKAMSEVKLPGFAQSSRMLSTGDLISDATLIMARTLVLVGAQDEITKPANCERLHDALVAASPTLRHRFEIVAQAGHAVTQEQPEAVARLIDSHLTPAES